MGDVRAGSLGIGLSAVLGTLLVSAAAGAQAASVSISLENNNDGVVRGPSYDSSYLRLNQFNRQNCLANEVVNFNVDIRGSQAVVGSFHLEAWVGSACEEAANRSDGVCTQVGVVGSSVERVELFVRDLAHSSATTDADPCASESELPTAATVTFMLLNNDGEPPPGSAWFLDWAYQYDLVPPTAPTLVRASAIAEGLHVTWGHPDAAADTRRYAFLCDPPPGAEPTDDLGPNELCLSPELGTGEVPTPEQLSRYECGWTNELTTSFDLTPLTPDVIYAVGVVAFDSYHNVSPLSDTACDTPYPPVESDNSHTVTTTRGCALGEQRAGLLDALLVAAGTCAVAVRRRARERRNKLG